MSAAGGETPGDTEGEGTAAVGRFSFSPEPTLEDVRRLHAEEVGELPEVFQWKTDGEPDPQGWSSREPAALQEELSDVLIYLVALAARCHVDLPQAVLSEMDINR
ncbi:dCTP pyrophosphatase 1 [Saguinus oedipus]|uniref:dCTP pyrophosphatase 1 n=1 Tax=Saguinus oedipus TaxID=9490 RepID=A0ABQ9V3Y1_SAGOE|nr:dCTP pyrophosphatase 1 [Saguinus oedipus]